MQNQQGEEIQCGIQEITVRTSEWNSIKVN